MDVIAKNIAVARTGTKQKSVLRCFEAAYRQAGNPLLYSRSLLLPPNKPHISFQNFQRAGSQ
jgi:hypothetical protein